MHLGLKPEDSGLLDRCCAATRHGVRGRELVQPTPGRLLVEARHQHEQPPVLVPAQPVAAAAEPLDDLREPLGDLLPDARPEPLLQRGHFGDLDDGEHAASPTGDRAAQFAVEFSAEVRRLTAGRFPQPVSLTRTPLAAVSKTCRYVCHCAFGAER